MTNRTTYLYVSSRGDNANEFSLDIPEDSLRCNNDEFIRLTLSQHTTLNQIYNVTEGNNKVTVAFNQGFSVPALYLTNGDPNTQYYALASVNTQDAWKGFTVTSYWSSSLNYSTDTGWYTGTTGTSTDTGAIEMGDYIELVFATPVTAVRYFFLARMIDNHSQPLSWTLLGYSGFAWYVLDTRNYSSNFSSGPWTCNNPNASARLYSSFRIVFRRIKALGGVDPRVAINLIFVTSPGTTLDATLAPGSYRISELVDAYNNTGLFNLVQYLPLQNKCSFYNQSKDNMVVTFQGNLATLFGCPEIELPAGWDQWYPAPNLVQPQIVLDLVLHLTHLMMDPPTNLSNLEGNSLNTSSIFAVIPMRAAPHTMNVFYNLANAYSVDIFDPDAQRIGFRVTDASGALIKDLPHWTAVIRVDYVKRPQHDAHLEMLTQMTEYLRLLFMNSAMKDADAEEDAGLVEPMRVPDRPTLSVFRTSL